MKKGTVFLMTLAVLSLLFAFNGRAYAETLLMSVSPLECNIGDTITVTYHGAPGTPAPLDDTIALFKAGEGNVGQAVAVQHLNGSMDGTLTFTAPDEVGQYNIRMLVSGSLTVAVSEDIDVRTQAVLSATPAAADPHGLITVNFSGDPGTAGDWIGLCTAGAQGGRIISSQSLNGAKSGVVTFNAPDQPGAYNFRLGTSDETILATSNDVQVANMVAGTPVQIVLQAYSPAMTVNGVNVIIDSAGGAVPIIKDGRILLPIRAIVENIGGTVGWDVSTQEMTIQVENRIIKLGIGQTTADVDGNSVPVDVAPQVINGVILMPLRFIADNLDAAVQWDEASQTVTLVYKQGTWTQKS